MTIRNFQHLLFDYYRHYGRHDLPWRQTPDPFHILISEYMLQQTQVERVILKYHTFIQTFPTPRHLAQAPLSRVLGVWQGLGYNKRALALKKTAHILLKFYQGNVPKKVNQLCILPGVGPATAGAVCAFAFNIPVTFMETNIRAVFLHMFMSGAINVSDRTLLQLVKSSLLKKKPRQWYQALMDFGVFIKKHLQNPSQLSAAYKKQSPFKNSDRQIRGYIIKQLIKTPEISEENLFIEYKCSKQRLHRIIQQLILEGMIEQHHSYIRISKQA